MILTLFLIQVHGGVNIGLSNIRLKYFDDRRWLIFKYLDVFFFIAMFGFFFDYRLLVIEKVRRLYRLFEMGWVDLFENIQIFEETLLHIGLEVRIRDKFVFRLERDILVFIYLGLLNIRIFHYWLFELRLIILKTPHIVNKFGLSLTTIDGLFDIF